MGVALSPARRIALLARAAKDDFVILEDDYDCEFYYGKMPSPCLQSADREQRVIYLGSLSKTLAPAFRLGFIVAPPCLLDSLRRAKWIIDRQTSMLVQNTLLQFMISGDFAVHLNGMRVEYKRRRAILLEAIRNRLSTWLTPLDSTCGLHISTRVNVGYDIDALCRIADEEGVGIYRGDIFSSAGRGAQYTRVRFRRNTSTTDHEGYKSARLGLAEPKWLARLARLANERVGMACVGALRQPCAAREIARFRSGIREQGMRKALRQRSIGAGCRDTTAPAGPRSRIVSNAANFRR